MAAFEDLLKQLDHVDSGQHVCEVASSARMNAIQQIIRMLVMGENIMEGPNIRKDSSQGKLILSADPAGDSGRGGKKLDLPFVLSLIGSEITVGDTSIRVRDGKVNGEFPEGMGEDDFLILEVGDLSDCLVYVKCVHDVESLDLTSLDVLTATSGTFPVNIVSETEITINVLIGFTYITEEGRTVVMNSFVGDIDYNLVYGAHNGIESVVAVQRFTDWMELPEP